MTAEHLLVVSARGDTRSEAARALVQHGYRVAECGCASEARALLPADHFDLVLMTCRGNGDEVILMLEHMKAEADLADVRTVVLQSASCDCDAVRFLESGTDDVVTFATDPRELVARVRTCLSRPAARPDSAPLRVGDLVLDTDRFRILAGGRVIDISLREFQLMHFLTVNRGVVHSRERLLGRVWSDQPDISPRTVDTHVRRLRVALQQVGCEHYLQTVRGVGYRFSSRVGANKTQPAAHVPAQRPRGFDNAEQSAT